MELSGFARIREYISIKSLLFQEKSENQVLEPVY